MRMVLPVTLVVAGTLTLVSASRLAPPAAVHAYRGDAPMDVLYAAPGDLNYSYGPTGSALRQLRMEGVSNAVSANITVIYDANFEANPDAKAAFQAGVDIWANTIATPAPIRVQANFLPLGAGVLGSAGPRGLCTLTTAGFPNTWYSAALSDKLVGSASCAAANSANWEITANFNSSFATWDYGTTGVGVPGKYNFMTVVVHELAHGLGFFGSMVSNGTNGSFGRTGNLYPDIYDRFAATGSGLALILFPNPSTALHGQLISNDTFFDGSNTRANNSGLRAKLETHDMTFYGRPSPFLQGSSYSHVDDVVYSGTPNGLMTFQLSGNEVYTDPGPVVRGMFADIGWSFAGAAGCTYALGATSMTAPRTASASSVGVTTQPGCGWTATSNAPSMITVTAGANSAGTGTVSFSITANPTTSVRSGTMTIAGSTFTVVQGAGCSYGLSSTSSTAAAGTTGGSVNVTTQPGCGWTAVSNTPSMLTVSTGATGSGNGGVTYTVGTNVSPSPRTGTLTIAGITFTVVQARSTFTAPNDVDADGIADLIMWRPDGGAWLTLTSTTGYNPASFRLNQWGTEAFGDIPLVGDIDGDALADLVIWRASTGTFFWLTSSSGYSPSSAGSKQWGNNSLGDTPMLADMDGDRLADLVIWRASTGTWHWLTSTSGYSYTSAGLKQWGSASAGDVPKLGDVDGDGRADLIVWRASTGTWFWLTSSTSFEYTRAGIKQWGNQAMGDTPLVADIDGDRMADLVLWRGPSGTWYWLTSGSGYDYAAFGAKQWGNDGVGDIPLTPDLDGDGKADLTIWRPPTGSWYWLTSRSGYNYANAMGKQWGSQINRDVPISK